jgi:hypothetical protein
MTASGCSLGRINRAFASDYGLPHGRAAWFCRCHPNVYATFQNVFEGEVQRCSAELGLCVGMDNVFFNNCAAPEGEEGLRDRMWPHVDQSIHVRPSGLWECVQGVLYIWPTTPRSSTTVVWPKSHSTIFPEMMNTNECDHHYCSLPVDLYDAFATEGYRVQVPAGALLLWNSRTVHQGWNVGPRLAFPICFEPRQRRDASALLRKTECCDMGAPTTHWASLGLVHGTCSLAPGGCETLPLAANAHKWMHRREAPALDADVARYL